MSPDRWEKINEIFNNALELPSAERHAYIERQCGTDRELLAEVRSLLGAESEAGDFIAEPAVSGISSGPSDELPQTLAGIEFGHFRIERCIGSGGMGDVYLATDTRLNRQTAIKTLPRVLARDPAFVKRFHNEALAAANLNHPNVATIYSVEDIDGRPIITMEYVDGKRLDEVTPEAGLDIRTFLDWFTCISDALAQAHERGIIHRDIKPGNILVSNSGVPKILDFGLAQVDERLRAETPDDVSLTQPGQVIGTPAYMSPEQAEGKEIDARSDIFSLGVVMYQALTGRRPFAGDSHAEIVSNLLKSDPPSIRSLRPEIPDPIVRLIDKCLAKSRRSRPRSMKEVNAILTDIWHTYTRGGSGSSLRRLYREFSVGSYRWMIGAAAVVLLGAVSGWYYFSQPTAGAISFANMVPRKLSQSNNVVYAHITPDGRSVVYNTIEENEQRAMYIRQVDDRTSLPLMPPDLVWYWGGLAISPDSTQIYFITAGRLDTHGTLYRISTLGGQPRKLMETVNDLGSLSADGERVLIIRYGETIQLISANAIDGGDERVLHETPKSTILRDPHFSADGRFIFLSKVENVGNAESWSLVRIPAEGGTETVVMQPRRTKINEIAVLPNGEGLLVNQGDAVSNLNQLFHVRISDGLETRVTNDLNSYFGISLSSNGRSVVTAQRSQTNDIWTGSADAPNELTKLTREATAYMRTSWTPDGKLVFDGLENNVPKIWESSLDGKEPVRLTSGTAGDWEPMVSPDGRYIFFVSDRSGERKIWRMNADGRDQVMIGPEEGTGLNPRRSADGRSVLFHVNNGEERFVGSLPMDGGTVSLLPPFGNTYWEISPTGDRIAVAEYDDASNKGSIVIRPLDANGEDIRLEVSPLLVFTWSHDGKSFFYRERSGGEDSASTIWNIDLATKSARPYLSTKPDSVHHLSISPDGKRVAVVRGKLITDAVLLTTREQK